MNEAIQKQLEERLEAAQTTKTIWTDYEVLARENAALRSLCAEALSVFDESWVLEAEATERLWALRERLQAAAAGKGVA